MDNKVNINSEITIANLGKSNTANNISCPSSNAAVVFGVHLSAQAVFRLNPECSGPAIRP
jgi:hypothetical protein